ncbi:MAG: hypothetical protein KAJ20_02390, partial [Candidatus Aenigmarchaeota archaeon]|nr:hypothetical protein [Candidatus Aenigmarchaeota archaeon]
MVVTNVNIEDLKRRRYRMMNEKKVLERNINDIKTTMNQKRAQINNFEKYYPGNNISVNAAKKQLNLMNEQLNLRSYSYRLNNKTIGDIDRQISTEIHNCENQQKELSKAMSNAQKGDLSEAEAEKTFVKRFRKIRGHAGKFHRGIKSLNWLMILLFISAIVVDYYGFIGKTFGVLSTPFILVPYIFIIQFIFIFWFFLDSNHNMMGTTLLVIAFLFNVYTPFSIFLFGSYFPLMLLLAVMRYNMGEEICLGNILTIVILL